MSRSYLAEAAALAAEESTLDAYAWGVPDRRPRAPGSFRRAVASAGGPGGLVVEYKRASPASDRPLPPPRALDSFVAATSPVDGVVAYSCLATRAGFEGAPAHVAELAAATARPVLFKEFVVRERQLDVAARTGASAVLLIARLEGDPALERPLPELARAARARGLEVVLEFHAPAELSRSNGVAADVYGVNVRDLATLRLERATAEATLAECVAEGRRPLLGLSGVDGPAEAAAFWRAGCDGILVGSAVSRASDPAALLASLRRPAEGTP